METLSKLFGSPARVKILRLFLANPSEAFEKKDIVHRTKVGARLVQQELSMLEGIDFVRKTSFSKEQEVDGKPVKKKVTGWNFNQNFIYRTHLENLLVEGSFLDTDELVRRLSKGGKLNLLIASGVFLRDPESRVDLLIVGDSLKRASLEAALRGIEAELGRELRYAIFDTSEFRYRLGMYDKFVRDVLDYPHERVIEKIRFE